ncbi:Caffeoyl-CoA O-methyltransferase [Bienertia sinuspersici]
MQEQQSSEDSIDKPGNLHLLSSLELFQYIVEAHGHPNQPVLLKKSKIEVPADIEQLYAINKMLRDAKNTLDIGAFTIYSLLSIALALPCNTW